MSRPCHSCFPLIVTWCLNHDILLEYESHWLIFSLGVWLWPRHCNSLSMICVTIIIILIPHILWTWLFIFVLLVSNLNCCSRRKCAGLHDSRTWNRTSRWVVVYRSFSWRRPFDAHSHVPNWPNHYIKPHAVQCMGRSWYWWLSRNIPAPLGQAYSTGGGFTASATTPCSSGSIIRSSNQSSIISSAMITVLCNFHSPGGTVFTHHTMGFMNHHIQRFVRLQVRTCLLNLCINCDTKYD